MNFKRPQPSDSPHKSETASAETGQNPSDSKEIIFLAGGLLTLVIGIGGLLMYTEEEPLPAIASQEIESIQMAKAFASPEPPSSFSDSGTITPTPMTNMEPDNHSITPPADTPADPAESVGGADMDVYFDFNSWTLSDEARFLIKDHMENRPEGWTGTLRVQGFTDSRGPDGYNKALGLRRAESVKTYLVSLGVPDTDIHVETMGNTGQVCEEETSACFELNRRAHVALLPSIATDGDDIQVSMAPLSLTDSIDEELVEPVDELQTGTPVGDISPPVEIHEESDIADRHVTVESLP